MTLEGPTPEHRRQQKNLKYTASALAFIIGFAVLLLLMLPNPWALAAGAVVGGAAAGGTYGMLFGRELSLQRKTEELTTQQESLRQRLREIETTVRTKSQQLPPSCHGQLRMTVVGLQEIVSRWETLERVPEQRYSTPSRAISPGLSTCFWSSQIQRSQGTRMNLRPRSTSSLRRLPGRAIKW